MDIKYIYSKLMSLDGNTHYINRYYKFIIYCLDANVNIPKDDYTERHHFLPSSLFQEYKSFSIKWNIVQLTARQHYIAHWILAKAYGKGMWYAFKMMCTIKLQNRSYLVNSKAYEVAKRQCALIMSNRVVSDETRSKMSASNKSRPPISEETKRRMSDSMSKTRWINNGKDDKRVYITEVESYLNDGWFYGRSYKPSEETIAKRLDSYNKNENNKNIEFTEEHKRNIGKASKGKVPVVDTRNGNRFKCSIDDPNYISGIYTHVAKGRSLSNEHKESLKGQISAYDTVTNERLKCTKDHPYWKSGRYVGVTKGMKIKCPYCDKEGQPGLMKRWHFDNCKLKTESSKNDDSI